MNQHWAAGNGHLDATRLLLEWERSEDGKKADINCLSDTTETPLDRALIWNHTAVIELLREHGALTGREVCGLPGHSSSLYRSYPDSELTSWLEADEEEFDRLFRTYFEALTIDQEVERTFARQTRGNSFWKRFFTPSRRRSPHSPLTSPLPPLSRPNSSDASAQYFDSDSNNEGDARDLS
jgi:ankyrin repeat protein